ncbi:MAG TPA: peptidyl-alpha-hydroxyglycine alpha-amidating lyase family protein [Bryobacteraceae bacterium]|nr:peptidyl-alpha-hydroxyglycine alpha-amidating lyase family protein [Bryobacteraceae bacterium]
MLRLILAAALAAAAFAGNEPNSQPNPYETVKGWFHLPEGRTMGSTSSVAIDSKGHIWIADRCGKNSCAGSDLNPVFEFDESGKMLKNFGAGMFIFPHGMFIDKQDNIYIADELAHIMVKLSPEGKVLLTIGQKGVASDADDGLDQPTSVAVAGNGDIFISEGHNERRGQGPADIRKYSKDGKLIKRWGEHGSGPGQLEMPHSLTFDTAGRLLVADRMNNRVEIFDQDGNFIAAWTQFSRPSGVFVDRHDVLYVTDSESQSVKPDPNAARGRGRGRGGMNSDYGWNPGWKRGVRIGSAKTGEVVAFIPDPQGEDLTVRHPATTGAEGLTVDRHGNIYAAEVGPKDVKRYVKK